MKKEEIINFLKSCGLTIYESNAYFALLSIGKGKALEISSISGIPQSKIYSILEMLVDKNLAEVSTGRPKEYKAVEPRTALRNLIKWKEEHLLNIKTKLNSVEKLLYEMYKSNNDKVITGVWNIKTNKWMEFFNKVSEMLDKSKNYVYAITRDYSKTSKLIQSAKAAIKRGVRIMVIGMESPNKDNITKIKIYKKVGVVLRYLNTPLSFHPRIVVVDGKEAIIRLDSDPSKREGFLFNAVWTQDPSMVLIFDNYLKSLWERSIPIK